MRHSTSILLLLCVSSVLCWSKHRVPEYPTMGNPIHCLAEEGRKNDAVKVGTQQCTDAFCKCLSGTLSDSTSLQCQGISNVTDCGLINSCYPTYLTCINNVVPGCAWAAQRQCKEVLQLKCDEVNICLVADTPEGITAGGIFAIAAALIYLIAIVLVIGLYMASRKPKEVPVPEE
eukprot:TRINITY_DN8845_c0_g1_i1.p1 TRINITY_DN8845_c0_g1~~TRINITY_DN8845_c0_g1_i1.p1  ORF type:complete len:175 (+),score=31.39 TRINITY_DN8845_c0_g1_i1:56-580(+)